MAKAIGVAVRLPNTMIIGILELTLAVPAFTLKEKRSVVRRILARTKQRFNVSAAEIDYLDTPSAAEIGLVTVGNDHAFIDSVLSKLENYVVELQLAEVTEVHREIQHL